VDKKPLIGKYMTAGIALLFIGTCFLPATATPLSKTVSILPTPENFFGLQSNIEITWNASQTEEPIIPRGESRSIALETSFGITLGTLGRLIYMLMRGKQAILHVTINDIPEWSSATLSQETLTATISDINNKQTLHTILTVAVDENAPAFEIFPVTIQITVEPIHGWFGFITLLHGTTQVVNVTFNVGYKPLISFFLPETNCIETPPLTQVELPIIIQNMGNGQTTVENEILEFPADWIVSLPYQIILEVGEEKEINLSILAPSNFSGIDFITLGFTPHSSENYSLMGSQTIIQILTFYHPD